MTKYADDITLFFHINEGCDSKRTQIELNHIVNWCYTNQLFINEAKCFVIHLPSREIDPPLTINENSVNMVNHIKNFGTCISNSMNWKKHFGDVLKKCHTGMAFLKTLNHYGVPLS